MNRNGSEIEMQKIEAKYKKNIENDIQYLVNNLPNDQKKLLGNFQTSFKKFKEKIELTKSSVGQRLPSAGKGREAKGTHASLRGEDFLFTILGLKPVSIEDVNMPILWGLNELYNLINKSYPDELSRGEFSYRVLNRNEGMELYVNGKKSVEKEHVDKDHYIMCHDPIMSPLFVKSCYPSMTTTPEFLEEFLKRLHSFDQKAETKFIKYYWLLPQKSKTIENNEVANNNLALLLGYVPTWFGKIFYFQTIECLFDSRYAQHFRLLLIPGSISCEDRSAYVQLYEKLLEYAWVCLGGLEYYIKTLEDITSSVSQTQSETNIGDVIIAPEGSTIPGAKGEEQAQPKNQLFDHIQKIVNMAVAQDKK